MARARLGSERRHEAQRENGAAGVADALIHSSVGGLPDLDPASSPALTGILQARRIITADHPYRPLFVEPRHDRCAELGAHVFVIGRRRSLCGELEAFTPTRQRSITQVSIDRIRGP